MDNHFPPPYNEDVSCLSCPGANVLTELHGVFGGGGPGRYTMCENCGAVLSKTCDSHEEEASDATSDQSASSDKSV
jgi:hypothetical protein